MQAASAIVVDLDAYRNSRKAKRETFGNPAPWPGAWVMVWFVPVFVVNPYNSSQSIAAL